MVNCGLGLACSSTGLDLSRCATPELEVASVWSAMGQPVTLIRTSAPRPGIVRFELNRNLTGMGHVRFTKGQEILASDPAARLAARLLESGRVNGVHVYGSVVTCELVDTAADGLEETISSLYTYYLPGVEIPSDEELIAMVEG